AAFVARNGPQDHFVRLAANRSLPSRLPLDHHLLDFADRFRRVQALGAGIGAIYDGVAAIEAERIFQIVQALAGFLVAAVDEPAVGLQARRRAAMAVAGPPIARARGRAGGAENAFVKAVQLGAVFRRLLPFLFRLR